MHLPNPSVRHLTETYTRLSRGPMATAVIEEFMVSLAQTRPAWTSLIKDIIGWHGRDSAACALSMLLLVEKLMEEQEVIAE